MEPRSRQTYLNIVFAELLDHPEEEAQKSLADVVVGILLAVEAPVEPGHCIHSECGASEVLYTLLHINRSEQLCESVDTHFIGTH